MLFTLKKRQDEVVYEVPIITLHKPDKEITAKIQKILDDTKFEGNYWDRVRFYMNLRLNELENFIPMMPEAF